jgi:hypothetical protein
MTLGYRAFADAFLNGMLGFFDALERAVCSLLAGQAGSALVIGTEEITPTQTRALTALHRTTAFSEGAAGLLIQRLAHGEPGWRLGAIGSGPPSSSGPGRPPDGWEDAVILRHEAQDSVPALHSLVGAFAIDRALRSGASRALLIVAAPGYGWRGVGLTYGCGRDAAGM